MKKKTVKAYYDFLDAIIEVEVAVFGYNCNEWKLQKVMLGNEDYTDFIKSNNLTEQVLDIQEIDKAIREMQKEFFNKMIQEFSKARQAKKLEFQQLKAA